MKAQKRQKPPKVTEAEKLQVRARRIVGHDFGIVKDGNGRERLSTGTAESKRQYEIGGAKVVRVRDVDPLIGISSLTEAQREAGRMYREDFEIVSREGIKPVSWEISVDGSSGGRAVPERIADAHANLASADSALRYTEIRRVVEYVCGHGMSVKALSEMENNPRVVVSRLLSMGLDMLAVHYGIVSAAKR